jgi:hypothetical protein
MKRVMTFLAAATFAAPIGYGCGSSDNGGAADAGGADAPTMDSPVSHRDSSPITSGDDGGGDGPVATGCPAPADISSWMAPALHPAKTSPSACTAQDLSDYDGACLNNATRTQAACTAFATSRATCLACLESKYTDMTWGPLVSYSGVVNLNLGGCVAIVDPAGAACAQKVQDYDQCVHTACDGVCPVNSPAAFQLWQQCQTIASQQACGMYSTAANCLANDTAAAVCNNAGGFDAAFMAVAPLFCGGASEGGAPEAGTSEAGTPEGGPAEAGPDAPAD